MYVILQVGKVVISSQTTLFPYINQIKPTVWLHSFTPPVNIQVANE